MKSGRRPLAVLAMASAVVAVSQLPAMAQSQPSIAADRIVGTATAAKLPKYVIYHSRTRSRISDVGHVTNGVAGEVLRFYVDQFPFRGWRAVAHKTLTHSGVNDFRFSDRPALATRYETRLFAKSGRLLATSSVKTVYVLADYQYRYNPHCGRPVCHITIHVHVSLPPSTLRAEMRKHIYTYFGYRLGRVREPALPKWLYRDADGGHVTGLRKVAADQYKLTLHFTFTIGQHAYRWESDFCTRNTEPSDGLYLPGHHGCGASRVSSHVPYLG
jgi:hypothetical protein